MREHIKVSYVGMTAREVTVIRSMFKVVPTLSQYVLIDPAQAHSANIVLVNVDYSPAVRWWNELRKDNKFATPIVLTNGDKKVKGHITIKRPIQLKQFVKALLTVTNPKVRKVNTSTVDGAPLKVLVVDDSFPVRRFLEYTLPKLYEGPIQINFADSGESAMQSIWQDPCDIVFLDVMMEGMDGYAVCKAIKADGFAYVVMLTSKKSPFDKIRGTMSGCDAYITKPPSEDRLREEMNKCAGVVKERAQKEGRLSEAGG